jgi:transposase
LDQENFIENTLRPLLKECENGERAVFFVDAAHFVFGSFVCKLWCRTRQWVRAASGRQRHNVLGALHAITKRVTTVVNDSYITAETVCTLFRKLRSQVDGSRKITVVLDNAKYQTCQLVRECAQDCQIELRFLPTYSPNLNLIERFWKYVKKKCLYGRYHENFSTFSTAIDDCITHASDKDAKALSSLLSPKFQTFINAQLYCA